MSCVRPIDLIMTNHTFRTWSNVLHCTRNGFLGTAWSTNCPASHRQVSQHSHSLHHWPSVQTSRFGSLFSFTNRILKLSTWTLGTNTLLGFALHSSRLMIYWHCCDCPTSSHMHSTEPNYIFPYTAATRFWFFFSVSCWRLPPIYFHVYRHVVADDAPSRSRSTRSL
jgi:hypothetical protein